QNLAFQVMEMMRLTKKTCDIGGQGGKHFLAFVEAIARGDQPAILTKIREPQRAQTLSQPRIDKRRLGLRQMNSSVFMNHSRDLVEIALRQQELTGYKPAAFSVRTIGGENAAHAASCSQTGSTWSSAIKLIMRWSTARTPRTKVFAISEATSGVGWTRSSVTVRMSDTASTRSPMVCAP